MKINEDILPILSELNIGQNDGLAFLLLKYYDIKPSFIPSALESKMNLTGIYYKDHNNSLAWKVPLFDEQQTAFDWVKSEYVPLFRAVNPEKVGNQNTTVRLMKKFFAETPDVRKDEVLGASIFYLKNTDPKYIRQCHYFIRKGAGANMVSDLTEWVEKYRKYQERETGRMAQSNTMQ